MLSIKGDLNDNKRVNPLTPKLFFLAGICRKPQFFYNNKTIKLNLYTILYTSLQIDRKTNYFL